MVEEIQETKGKKLNPWILSTIILSALVITLLIFLFRGGITGNVIGDKDIGKLAMDFATSNLNGLSDATLDSVKVVSGVYQINIDAGGQKLSLYFTKDGKWISQGSALYSITGNDVDNQQQTETPIEVPKSNKPVVELFVMSYCPFGTQAEKGLIPVYNLLKNVADIKIRFVSYTMHGEKEDIENSRQICLREEQPSKFIPYLTCFLEASDAAGCLKTAGVDETKLTSCMTNNAAGYTAADAALNTQYGVQGSPTLVINGVEIPVTSDGANYLFNDQKIPFSRSANTYKTIICSLFNTSPSECSQSLSTANPSAGFGSGTSSGSSDASCS